MEKLQFLRLTILVALTPLVIAVSSQQYTWKNVKIGGGGGFVPGIVFNPSQKVHYICYLSYTVVDET